MYQGNNTTAVRSQQWLAKAMARLLEAQSYASVTVGALCKEADLSRQTFYNVFDSKEEVLRFCLRSEYEKQFRRFMGQETISAAQIVEAFAVVVSENQRLLQLMVNNDLASIITDEMAQCIALFVRQFVKLEKKDALLPYGEALLSGALAHLLIYWFRQEQPISMEQLTKLTSDFLQGKLFGIN